MARRLLEAGKREFARLLASTFGDVGGPVDRKKKVNRQGLKVRENREEYTLLQMEDVVNDPVSDNKPNEGLDMTITQDLEANRGASSGCIDSAQHSFYKNWDSNDWIFAFAEVMVVGVTAYYFVIWALDHYFNYRIM